MKQLSDVEDKGFTDWKEKVIKTTKGQEHTYLEKVTNDGIKIPLVSINNMEFPVDEKSKDYFNESTKPQLFMSDHYLHHQLEGVDVYLPSEKSSEDYLNIEELQSKAIIAGQHFHVISTYPLHQSGVPVQHELAFVFSAVEELLRKDRHFFSTANERLLIHLPTDQHFLTEIAKYDALRNGLYTIFSDEGFSSFPGIIMTSPSTRRWSTVDAEMNLLRFTNSVTISALSGIGTLYSIPYDKQVENGASKRGCRLARTIPYLVWEEAKLYPSTYISEALIIKELSEKIYEESWELYHAMEVRGGVTSWLQNQELDALCQKYQNELSNEVIEGTLKLVGSNIYQSTVIQKSASQDTEYRWSKNLELWQERMHTVTYSLSEDLSIQDSKEVSAYLRPLGIKKVDLENATFLIKDITKEIWTLRFHQKEMKIPVTSRVQFLHFIWKELV